MFRFEDSTAFYLWAVLPLLGLIFFWSVKRLQQRISRFGDNKLVQRLFIGDSRRNTRLILLLSSIIFVFIALVNPQWGLKKEKVKVEKSDIFIALDISNSMNATDISPSRLEKAKKCIEQLIEARRGDQIGLILFAGSAYLQMPLTNDYAAAELFVRSANTQMAGTQGTAIGDAIDLAVRSTKDKNQRALVVFSDGEDHDQDAIDRTANAVSNGWSVFTIGVGTEEGSFVPVLNDGREEYKTDDEGNPVKSSVNQQLLKKIAEEGNGAYYLLTNDNRSIINDINAVLDKIQKRAVEIQSFTEYRSFYQYFLFVALVLLVVEFFIRDIDKKLAS
jgi:Ca-activated chloride channel family protein